MRVLVLLQVFAAGVASLLAYHTVETIVGTCPTLAVIGLALALGCASGRQSITLAFALSAPLVTGVVAAMIAIFHLAPEDAQWPVGVILASYFVGTLLCLWPALGCLRPRSNVEPHQDKGPTQFSLRTILILTTILGVLFGLARWLDWRSEMQMFGAYAGAMFAAVMAIGLRYAWPTRHWVGEDAGASGSPLDDLRPPTGASDES